jgi:hypothetical protein
MNETVMTPNEIIEKMQNTVEQLKIGAAVMYETLQSVAGLHSADAESSCTHCSEVAGTSVWYPCPTISIILGEFEVVEVSLPETDPQSD